MVGPGLKILTLTSLFPNQAQPRHGLFVERRLTHLLQDRKDIEARVVAPVPWFPFKHSMFGRYALFAQVPAQATRSDVTVYYPRYPTIPMIGMNIAPYLYARFVRGYIEQHIRPDFPFDIIDAHYFYPDGVAAAALAKHFDVPFVVTARGSDVNVIADFPKPQKEILDAASASHGIVTVSEALKQRLVNLGVSASKVSTIRNGVDMNQFHPQDAQEQRQRLGLHQPTLLSVGNLLPNKGHDLAITALRDLPEYELVIAGEGPMEESLKTLAKQLAVETRVRFVGSIDQKTLVSYYSACDLLVLMSENEGLPNVVLEALACGTPVIATNAGGIPEVLSDPKVGTVLAERSVQALVAGVRDSHPPGSDYIREIARGFDWSQTSHALGELFDRVLSEQHITH